MDSLAYWLWLQSVFGAGSVKPSTIISVFGSPKAFYEAGFDTWHTVASFTPSEKEALKKVKPEESVQIIEQCHKLGYTILTPDHPDYPQRLVNIPNYPTALYVSGSLEEIDDQVAVSIVGTRMASPYGSSVATHLALTLAKAGAIIVSGGAYGIDTCAHKGALLGGGKTICVLGCGINTPYLTQNKEMRDVIENNGALVSEYPPGATPSRYSFPIRNRLIAGLSLGVVIIEAGVKSGSLITANHAVQQGRDVFAVPGSIISEFSAGCNRLIRDGAKPISCALDILEEYVRLYPHRLDFRVPGLDTPAHPDTPTVEAPVKKPGACRPKKPASPSKTKTVREEKLNRQEESGQMKLPVAMPDGLSDIAKQIFSVLEDEPVHIDEIALKADVSSFKASAALTELEMTGTIDSLAGRRFKRR